MSSPAPQKRVIIRISGPNTIDILQQTFSPPISVKRAATDEGRQTRLVAGSIAVDDELRIDAQLYLFLAPHSYTGDNLAEIHVHTNPAVAEALMNDLLAKDLRMAGPGEFTARAYLNGKIDLAQAEAVNEIVVSSNTFQLAAAEQLLSGRLGEATEKVRSSLMDCLSLIEAGLDFSGEDIEFITCSQAVERLTEIRNRLQQLLSASISYESVIDLPAVGIAGAPNAGKSSLLNKLLGRTRSIVSDQRKTTRDVLTGELELDHCRCVLFDCAGLVSSPNNILDELAQAAAIEALQNASLVVFCIDISKTSFSEDIAIRDLLKQKAVIPVATKSDLLTAQVLANRLFELNELSAADFLPISVITDTGIEQLRDTIDRKLVDSRLGSAVALTARHKRAVNEAIENITSAIDEFKAGTAEGALIPSGAVPWEITAMMLRAAYHAISDIDQHHIDEQILEQIFGRFCIGK